MAILKQIFQKLILKKPKKEIEELENEVYGYEGGCACGGNCGGGNCSGGGTGGPLGGGPATP